MKNTHILFSLMCAGGLALSAAPAQAAIIDDVLSVRLEQEYVTKLQLSVDHYTSTQEAIDEGTITNIRVERDSDSSFNNPKAQNFSVADLIADDLYDSDRDQFLVTVTDLNGVKGYYFRVRFEGAENTTGEWHESGSRYVTLPPKVGNLRVPSGKKTNTSARLKWDQPERCTSEGCVYLVKVYKKSNGDLIASESAYQVNYVHITGLAAGTKYYYKVQSCLDYSTCSTKFSDTKKFKTNSDS